MTQAPGETYPHRFSFRPYCIAIPVSVGVWSSAGLGLAALLVGNPFYDERLVFAGIPVNPVIFLILSVTIGTMTFDRRGWHLLWVGLLPTSALAVSALWSREIEYGLLKYTTFIFSAAFAYLFFISAVRQGGIEQVLRIVSYLLLGLLGVAVVYKLQYGFFDRNVNFFLNGPIVFGRLMSLGAIAALFAFHGGRRAMIAALFIAAILWTQSKGPLLAFAGVGMLIAFLKTPRVWRFWVSGLIVVVAVVVIRWLIGLSEETSLGRFSAVLKALADLPSLLAGSGPLGNRITLYRDTFEMILAHPWGVGLGAWMTSAPENYGFLYPHNLFLEVFSESGVILGFIGVLPLIAFLFFSWSPFTFIALFFLLAQQVSGDLADARFVLVFSLLALYTSLFAVRQPQPSA